MDGVVISISKIQKAAMSDLNGNFYFRQLQPTNYDVTFSYMGFSDLTLPIRLFQDTTIEILMSPIINQFADVVVTAETENTKKLESSLPTTAISKNYLQSASSTNIIDAISKLPGIAAITTGTAVAKPVIRGLGYNRVVVLYDGFKQEEQQWGDEHGVGIDEASISRIEIIKGAGCLKYGSDAIAGAINFFSDSELAEGKTAISGMLNYQSNNKLISTSLLHSGNIRGVDWHIRASNKTASNFANRYDGVVWNSGFNEWNVNAGVGTNIRWGNCSFLFTSFNQKLGINEGVRDSLGRFIKEMRLNDTVAVQIAATPGDLKGYKFSVPYQSITHNRIAVHNKIFIGRGSFLIDASWQMNVRKEFGDVLQPASAALLFSLHTGTLNFDYLLPNTKGWEMRFGLSFVYQNNHNKGSEFLIPNYQQFENGFWTICQKKFKNLHFEAGLRFDYRVFSSNFLYLNKNGDPTRQIDSTTIRKFTGIKKLFYDFSGSVGFSYTANDHWTFRFNLSKGFRAPVAVELCSNGAHEGSNRYEYGNTKLKPESNYQIDAGVSYSSKHLTIKLDLFENTIVNYIYSQKLSSYTGSDSLMFNDNRWMPAYRFEQNHALLAGLEAEINIHPLAADWLRFRNAFGYVYAQQIISSNSAKYLPFTPPAHYRGELQFDIPKTGKTFQHLFIGMHFDYYFRQNHVLSLNNTETPTPDYCLLGASTGVEIFLRNNAKLFAIIFSADNILNTAFQSHLSRLKYLPVNAANGKQGIWNMGRNFSIKLLFSLQFDFKKTK